jgi:hypothetical protein
MDYARIRHLPDEDEDRVLTVEEPWAFVGEELIDLKWKE